jgi:glycosyltransferase involved in cell wall biosynthesis
MTGVTTIITCMTDAERPFVAVAIRSVQRQTVPTRIILCVAEDNEWIDDMLASLEPGVELLRLKPAWAGAVRNRAIERSRTEFVAFLDGDDVWKPAKIAKQLDFMARYPELDVIGTKHVLIRAEGTPYFFGFAKELPMLSTWLGRTDFFLRYPFDDSAAIDEDAIFWDDVLKIKGRYAIMDEFLINYRVREVSLSSRSPEKQRKMAYARRSRIFGMRPVLLGVSYAVNLGLRVRKLAVSG